MTEVVDPTTVGNRLKTLAGNLNSGLAIPASGPLLGRGGGRDGGNPLSLESEAFGPATAVQGTSARVLGRIRAWVVVPVVDFALMVAPIAWRPPQIYATVLMAVLATLLLSGGGRYLAPLHLSVLDELPSI